MSEKRCFLCEKFQSKSNEIFLNIATTKVPASQKPVQTVLQHLAKCIPAEIVFQTRTCICAACYEELSNYDAFMLNLLLAQKKLTKQLHKTLTRTLAANNSKANKDEEEFQSTGEEQSEKEFITICAGTTTDEEIADFIAVDTEQFDVLEETLMEADIFKLECVSDETVQICLTPAADAQKRSMLECDICEEKFSSKSKLQLHMSEAHKNKTYTCKICGVVRRDEEYLELHMNIHEGKTEHECRYCDKRFSRPVNTLRHMRKHWDKKKFQCEKCGECFSLDNMLYNHRLRHEAEEHPIICQICYQTFKSRKTYNHHVLVHREDRPRHHCTLCSKSFTERYTLKMHMRTHAEIVVTEGANEIIDQSSTEEHEHGHDNSETNDTKTVEEMQIDQYSEAVFYCPLCNINFNDKELLEQHLQTDHDVVLK